MLPSWIFVVAGLELVCFLIFGISIATAIPESHVAAEPARRRVAK